jgi:putative serine protease PepD
VSTPIPGPQSGPYVYPEYPERAYAPYPPLGYGADLPPAPAPQPRKKSNAGKIVALLAGAGVIALMASMVGGTVGYVIARETLPPAAVAAGTTTAAIAQGSPSALPGTIADIAARVQPAVVQLNVKGDQGAGTGSGFIISSDGYIITNNHVAGVAGQGGSIDVVFSDGSTATGRLMGANSNYDLAVVKVDKTNVPTVPLGSSAGLKVGDSVIAVGSPLGLQGTVTTGIVSALDRPVTAGGESGSGDVSFIDAIQTDAAINPGNSGGPLLNGSGEVIGVNSAIASTGAAGGGQPGNIGLGFAIPIDTAKRIANEIVKTGKSSTPMIGVSLDSTFTGEGAQVGEVTAGGAAAAAGVQTGDVIVAVDGAKVADSTELIVKVRAKSPGDTVTLTIQRNGQSVDVPVTLGSQTS